MYYMEITWVDKASLFLSAGSLLVTIFIAIMANRWALKYWRKQKKEEINYELEAVRYTNMMEAAKAVWGLLAFLTEKENGKNLLNYKGTKENPEVFFNLERGRSYLSTLSEIFYDKGHGVFLTKEINQEIFHVRTNVYRIIDREARNGTVQGEILMQNPEAISFFRNSFDDLRSKIKNYVFNELKYQIDE